jgi:hypothetical protein
MANWDALAGHLEGEAAITATGGASLSDRLERAFQRLGDARFQREVRRRVYRDLCVALVTAGKAAAKNNDDPVPPEIRQLARLGMSANPIVNFNLEHETSSVLASGGGGGRILDFDPRDGGTVPKATGDFIRGYTIFRRSLYHPHGTITMNGPCVLTSSGYATLNGTLAFEIASHAAFGTNLWIVGMSLEDQYLREQLTRFRPWIGYVVWFCDSRPNDELIRWAEESRVAIWLVGSWAHFWASVGRSLTKEDDLTVALTWLTVFQRAYGEIHDRVSEANAFSVMRTQSSSEESMARLKNFLEMRGQVVPPDNIDVSHEPPRDHEVEGALMDYAARQNKPWP